nr:trehalose 6-phosphate synthase [uncultured Pseudodesulfovibrio sp.]
MPDITPVALKTLKDFYDLMAATRTVRFNTVASLLEGNGVVDDAVASLINALESLEAVPEEDGKKILSLDGERTIALDMEYEINETRKDIFYLEEGEETFLEFLADFHSGFDEFVRAGHELIEGIDFNTFITDRDGTINNYCARYLTSIQSIYNSVFLTRFAQNNARRPVVLTSAPLDGLIEISVNPESEMYYAASKGRECLDLEGRIRRLPIPKDKQEAMDCLNARLTELTGRPEYQKFTFIGSGLQFKFGQSTVARQDIGSSIDTAASDGFLKTLEDLVTELDPESKNFRIEDTGLDVEIILTVETSGDGLKDFDKGDGVKFLNSELDLQMFRGPHLICGDTGSDVPMLEAALELTSDVRAIYVTQNEELAKRVTGLTSKALIVPEPDMLVTILGTMSPAMR